MMQDTKIKRTFTVTEWTNPLLQYGMACAAFDFSLMDLSGAARKYAEHVFNSQVKCVSNFLQEQVSFKRLTLNST